MEIVNLDNGDGIGVRINRAKNAINLDRNVRMEGGFGIQLASKEDLKFSTRLEFQFDGKLGLSQ